MAAASDFRALEATNRRESVMLVAVMILILAALGFGLDVWSGAIRISQGQVYGFPILTVFALIFGGVQALVSFYGGARLVLLSVHARALTPDSLQHQQVLDVINEMAIASQLPVPRAYIMDDPAPNAFATGRDPQHSVICVTQGLVDEMDREELQGVIGHEMSHIRDYDIRTMMIVAVMVGGIAMLSDFFFRMMFYSGGRGGGRSSNSKNDDGGALVLIYIATLILAVVAPIISKLVAMAISRQREYLADASSVEFTRNPRALLRALEQIAKSESPLKAATSGTGHLFIVNPREGLREDKEGFLDNLLSSHPPLAKRIERLRGLLGQAGQA
ncbi:MAG TPA: M48 family metallopeptidase [Candidatus Binataceae bacterium]|nr:M48 family metallopeptidase [Candidatus Binataceae bacterium]